MRLGFFAYPWDVLDEGPEQAVQAMSSRYHCNAIALNSNYHHARLLRPRALGAKTLQLPGSVAAFDPQTGLYPDERLMPVPHHELAQSGVLARTRDACAKQGLDFGLWTVGLHNSTLGERYPHLCMSNCFGEPYTYCLCPAQEPVRDLLAATIKDLCAQFQPERIIQEAVGFLGLRHWVHHELFFAAWDETLEMLLSLCFCPACQQKAGAEGLNADQLRHQVAGWSERLLAHERGNLPQSFTQGDVSSLLVEMPDLAEYLKVRAHTVTTLVEDLRSAAAQGDAELDTIPASFHRPASRAWLEGALLSGLSKASDSLLLPTYFESAEQVAADLQWARWLAPECRLSAGLNACEPSLSPGTLAAQVNACKEADCQGVYAYNYGLLTENRLDWVAQAYTGVRES